MTFGRNLHYIEYLDHITLVLKANDVYEITNGNTPRPEAIDPQRLLDVEEYNDKVPIVAEQDPNWTEAAQRKSMDTFSIAIHGSLSHMAR
jgi:hypothetical protein